MVRHISACIWLNMAAKNHKRGKEDSVLSKSQKKLQCAFSRVRAELGGIEFRNLQVSRKYEDYVR